MPLISHDGRVKGLCTISGLLIVGRGLMGAYDRGRITMVWSTTT